ncbi:sel1 repeat family protein [Methyloligella sp. 2.7D]|uniref:sel1 repeat family protein n=1 Tax=unclassified Methyloligella TaxID=2625955 RepID=UPI00157D38F1|nr:sel1 repeat family protein [Methyloligella sp. GL2]QKP77436.1 sel1 repeat family protein [Methyloligella sp. GL2]
MARLDIFSEQMDRASQSSAPDVLFQLGIQYSTGRDVETDLVTAHKWFNLAAVRGNDTAKTYRVELAQQMSADQIAEAQRQAREWLSTH